MSTNCLFKVQTGQTSNLSQNKGGCIRSHCWLQVFLLQWLGTSSPTFHYWPPLPVPAKTAFCWTQGKSHAMQLLQTAVTPFLQSHTLACPTGWQIPAHLSRLDTNPLTCINWKHPPKELVFQRYFLPADVKGHKLNFFQSQREMLNC